MKALALKMNLLLLNWKQGIVLTLKTAVLAAILVYVVNFVQTKNIMASLMQVNLYLIGAAFGLTFVNLFLQFWKWKVICNSFISEHDNKKIFSSLFYGFSAGLVTPFKVGEYVGRNIVLSDKSSMKVIIGSMIDKFFPLVVVYVIGTVLSLIFSVIYLNLSVPMAFIIFAVAILAGIAIFSLMFNPELWNSRLIRRIRKYNLFDKFFSEFGKVRKLDGKSALKTAVISVFFYACYVAQYGILVAAFTGDYNFANYLWAGSLVFFTKTVIPPITVGDLGVREAASIFFLSEMGVGPEAGLNASIFIFLINVLLPSLFGLFLIFKNKK
jgi:uncharacterized membrane protein YbhN (UPF0104 family)